MNAASYLIHGVRLRVTSAGGAVAGAVDRRLCHFRARTPDVASPHLEVELGLGRLLASQRPRVGPDARPVYDTPGGPVLFDEASDVLSLDYSGRAHLVVRASTGQAQLWATDDAEGVWLVTHPLLTLALVELLKRRGRYGLHAAGVSPEPGKVVLLAGPSGAGKTTLTLALVAAGWGFLADDTVFLDPAAGAATVLGFPDEIDVSDETLRLLPHLGAPPASGRAKRQLTAEGAGAGAPERAGDAAALVFPVVAERAASALRPMTASDALAALAPNVLLTEPASSQAHLDALARLVAAVPAWRLETGRDFTELAGRLRSLAVGMAL